MYMECIVLMTPKNSYGCETFSRVLLESMAMATKIKFGHIVLSQFNVFLMDYSPFLHKTHAKQIASGVPMSQQLPS